MNPEDIGRILDEIGERIGPAGDAAWHIAVNGERLMGVIGVSLCAVGGLVTVALIRLALWAYHKHQNAGSYDSHDLAVVIFSIGSVAVFVPTVIGFSYALPSLLAPEYVVIRELIGGIR